MAPYVPTRMAERTRGHGLRRHRNAFDKTTPQRLKVVASPPVVLFKGMQCRNKIGLSAQRTRGIVASMDWKREILTIVKTPVVDPRALRQRRLGVPDEPLQRDAVNSYNDGRRSEQGTIRLLLRARDPVAAKELTQERSSPTTT